MVYTTFATARNSIAGSAVCNFNITAVEATFSGPFKHQSRPDSTWGPSSGSHRHFGCAAAPSSDDLLVSRKFQLMDAAVQPDPPDQGPLYHENLNRFQHVVVDVVPAKHHASHPVHVIFVSTEVGEIKKLSYNPQTRETCLLEVLHPFPENERKTIRTMKILPSMNSVYLATDDAILRLPVQRCSRFITRKDCLNAMDPYCGWNRNKEECQTAPNKNPSVAYWQQEPLSCPVTTDPVAGGWGDWSAWFQCSYDNPDRRVESSGDYCMCQRRTCDRPRPANGGALCD